MPTGQGVERGFSGLLAPKRCDSGHSHVFRPQTDCVKQREFFLLPHSDEDNKVALKNICNLDHFHSNLLSVTPDKASLAVQNAHATHRV